MRKLIAVYLLLLGALVAPAVVGGVLLLDKSGPDDAVAALGERYAYDVPQWEIRHLPGKILYKIGNLFDGGASREQEDETVRRYFQLTADIAALERQLDGSPERALERELAAKRDERRDIENRVEDILEGRITGLLREQRLTISPPLFTDIDLLFPPVDFEFDGPPHVLATSPRDRIELDSVYLLTPSLDAEEVRAIEAEAEAARGDGLSAIVVRTGGVATYPSIIPERASQSSTVDTIIHEWIHQYLALHPLGRGYFASDDLRTLNETVANLAGEELAGLLLDEPKRVTSQPQLSAEGGFDFRTEMQALRLEVERLLDEGEIVEAERLMEKKRELFAENGYYIRRINQAYFAYYGSYADAPASIDPIGDKLISLRQRVGSVGEFVRLAAGFTGVDDLDRALEELGAKPESAHAGPPQTLP